MPDLGGPFPDVSVPPGSNLLVVGPPHSGKRRFGHEILAHGLDRDEEAIVLTNTDGVDRIRETFAGVSANGANGLTVIDCISRHQGIEPAGEATFAASPDDMTGAGIGLSEQLEERAGTRVRVMLATLSPLLIYDSLQTTFRFLHVVTNRIETADGLGVHILEAGVHDEETVGTLAQLYDGIVRTFEDDTPEFATAPAGVEPA